MDAVVIPLPRRLCLDCVHFFPTWARIGWCGLLDEEVGDEHIAELCPEFEWEWD